MVNHRFGEGWKAGDIVDMDYESARVPLQEGAIVEISEAMADVEEYEVSASATVGPAQVIDMTDAPVPPVHTVFLGDVEDVYCMTCKKKTVATSMTAEQKKRGWYAKGKCGVCDGNVSKKVALPA